jgi:uncharacterized protein
MATVPLAGLYAAVLSFLFIFLSARVIVARRSARVAIGTAGSPILERAVRVHANFAEYVPLTLLLLLMTEMAGFSAWIIHGSGILLVLARLVHARGVSQKDEDFRLRTLGIATTLTIMAALGLLLLARSAGLPPF